MSETQAKLTIHEVVEDRPELVCLALARVAVGEPVNEACSWVWFQCNTLETRDAVGRWLVAIGHPSAWEAGLPEQRFRAVVTEFASELRGEQ